MGDKLVSVMWKHDRPLPPVPLIQWRLDPDQQGKAQPSDFSGQPASELKTGAERIKYVGQADYRCSDDLVYATALVSLR